MQRTKDRYLYLRDRTFYFRYRIPDKFVAVLGTGEIKRSLQTADVGTARIRCRKLSVTILQLIAKLEGMADPTKPEIIKAARAYLESELIAHDQALKSVAGDEQFGAAFQAEAWGQERFKLQRNIADYNFDMTTKRTAIALLAAEGYAIPAEGTEAFDNACHYTLRAEAELARIMIAKFAGNFADTAVRDPELAAALLAPMAAQTVVPESDPLGKLIDKYINLKSKGAWTHKTKLDNERGLRLLREAIGEDTPVAQITAKDIRDFRDLIMAMPKHLSMRKKTKNLTLAKAVEKAGNAPTVSAKTADKYQSWVRSFFDWARAEGHIALSPAAGIKVPHKAHSIDARLPYSTAQLHTLFHSPMYTGCLSAHKRHLPGPAVIIDGTWWLPLLCLFTGARPGELVQLGLNDIAEVKGVLVVDINPDGEGKKLKSAAATRRIPVHQQLVKLGFDAYVRDRQAATNSGRLFEDVAMGALDPSSPFSKWYARYSGKIEIKTAKTKLYSLRHCFIDALREASVPLDVQQALMGHASGSITSMYGSALPVHILNLHIQKISFGVTFGHLRNYKPKTAPPSAD